VQFPVGSIAEPQTINRESRPAREIKMGISLPAQQQLFRAIFDNCGIAGFSDDPRLLNAIDCEGTIDIIG
jgi:hypothetical protein